MRTSFVLAAPALFLAACGGTSPIQPKDLTAGAAIGETLKCDDATLASEAMTFVVDWQDGQRAALESAMGKGVAVVRYTCEGVQVLPACRVSGDYGYAGATRRKKMIDMDDAVSAQVQLGGRLVGASFEGQFAQGRSLSLAYTTVGANATTVTSVERGLLTGRCDGATHFVYEAEVGAFAVGTRSKGEAAAFAEVFAYGSAQAATASSKSTLTSDGDLPACDKATKRDLEPADDCGAIVRVSLLPIGGEGASAKAGVPDLRGCPAGYVFADEECVPRAGATSFLCAKGDYHQCFEQCAQGHPGSCGRLGLVVIQGEEDVRADTGSFDLVHWEANGGQVADYLKRACLEGGEANACVPAKTAYGYADDLRYDERDPPPDVQKQRQAQALELFEAGCRGGEGFACRELADVLLNDRLPSFAPDRMLGIAAQACSRSPVACALLGNLNANAYGSLKWKSLVGKVPVNVAAARAAYERACDGGLADGCYGLGFMHLPPAETAAIMQRLIAEEKATDGEAEGAAHYSSLGAGLHDAAKAKAWLKRACALGEAGTLDADNEIACGAAR